MTSRTLWLFLSPLQSIVSLSLLRFRCCCHKTSDPTVNQWRHLWMNPNLLLIFDSMACMQFQEDPTYCPFTFQVLNGAKPILQEVGPFVYKSETFKENIKWHDDNTMSYRPRWVCKKSVVAIELLISYFRIWRSSDKSPFRALGIKCRLKTR